MNFTWRSTTTHGAAAGAAGVLLAAATLISPFEGYFGKTYVDPVGVPTVCYGETAKWAVEEGKSRAFTKTECVDMLAKSLPKYDAAITACIKAPMPRSVHVAFLSTSYNIGSAGLCRSSMAKRANAGDWLGACDALLSYDKAGRPPRALPGLTKRRQQERKTCLEDVT